MSHWLYEPAAAAVAGMSIPVWFARNPSAVAMAFRTPAQKVALPFESCQSVTVQGVGHSVDGGRYGVVTAFGPLL